ncbi:hypothetical protein ACFUJR_07805 [Streptomyces sp. NPDC057271]|uniref:hypothetical protein n=1 Tax=unclassified Streptomyces TaxID=2593676 RepID=UPI00363DA02D
MPDRKPCRVAARQPVREGQNPRPSGRGACQLSRLADGIESVQLGMAGDLLGHAGELLADRRASGVELRYLAGRLAESLRDVKRVAESRGARLGR